MEVKIWTHNLPLSNKRNFSWCAIVQVQDTSLLGAYLFSLIFPIYSTVVARREYGALFCLYEVTADLRVY
jgi:hypothetical protein